MPATPPLKAPPIAPVISTNQEINDAIQRLRTNVQSALNAVAQQQNTAQIVDNLDVRGHRITNVAWPTSLYDGVPKIYVDKHRGTFSQSGTKAGGKDAYTIVYANSNFVVDGDVAPAFIVGSQRSGDPLEAWLYAEAAPTTNSLTVNFTINGTNVLTSDLIIASSTTNTATGPIFTQAFVAVHPALTHGAIVIATFSSGGVAQGVTAGLIVRRK